MARASRTAPAAEQPELTAPTTAGRPPLVGAATWSAVMDAHDGRCQCTATGHRWHHNEPASTPTTAARPRRTLGGSAPLVCGAVGTAGAPLVAGPLTPSRMPTARAETRTDALTAWCARCWERCARDADRAARRAADQAAADAQDSLF